MSWWCLSGLLVSVSAFDRPKMRVQQFGPVPLDVHFLHPEEPERFVTTVEVGETMAETTGHGHRFKLSERDGKGNPAIVTIRQQPVTTFKCGKVPEGHIVCTEEDRDERPGRERGNLYAGPEWERLVQTLKQECKTLHEKTKEDEEHFCEDLDYTNWVYAQCKHDLSPWEFRERFREPRMRQEQAMREHPQIFKKFTHRGFDLTAVPADLLNELQTFWKEGRRVHSRPQQSPMLDGALSGCQSNAWDLPLPLEMHARLFDTLRPLVARWAGLQADDLEGTALYGIRMYRNPSLLNWHVDRQDTHVLSAILEVGHLAYGSDENYSPVDWPLEIYDHNGTLHKVPSKVGQMIYYESAVCPHSRPTFYEGREMANVFVHYRPKGWPKGYTLHDKKEL